MKDSIYSINTQSIRLFARLLLPLFLLRAREAAAEAEAGRSSKQENEQIQCMTEKRKFVGSMTKKNRARAKRSLLISHFFHFL